MIDAARSAVRSSGISKMRSHSQMRSKMATPDFLIERALDEARSRQFKLGVIA